MNIQSIARFAVLAPLFIIPFLALYISSDLFFPFITGKNFAFRALVEIAFVGYVVLALADKRYRPQFSWVLSRLPRHPPLAEPVVGGGALLAQHEHTEAALREQSGAGQRRDAGAEDDDVVVARAHVIRR